MTTYQLEAKKCDVSLSTVKIVSDKMGLKHRITTPQIHALEKHLDTIRESRESIAYIWEMGREASEEKALNEWLEERSIS